MALASFSLFQRHCVVLWLWRSRFPPRPFFSLRAGPANSPTFAGIWTSRDAEHQTNRSCCTVTHHNVLSWPFCQHLVQIDTSLPLKISPWNNSSIFTKLIKCEEFCRDNNISVALKAFSKDEPRCFLFFLLWWTLELQWMESRDVTVPCFSWTSLPPLCYNRQERSGLEVQLAWWMDRKLVHYEGFFSKKERGIKTGAFSPTLPILRFIRSEVEATCSAALSSHPLEEPFCQSSSLLIIFTAKTNQVKAVLATT